MVVNYKAGKDQLFHLSAVGILVNEHGEICCHHFERKKWSSVNAVWEDVYLLLSETVEEGESLIETILRGAEEECNAICDAEQFLGTHCYSAFGSSGEFQKTVVYFVLRIRDFHKVESNEEGAELRFVDLQDLISHMESQRRRGLPEGVDGLEGLYRYAELIGSAKSAGVN